MRRTFTHIPGQMSEAIERVERKRCGEQGFTGIFGGIWQSRDKFDDVNAVKGAWYNEVGNREPVEHYYIGRNIEASEETYEVCGIVAYEH